MARENIHNFYKRMLDSVHVLQENIANGELQSMGICSNVSSKFTKYNDKMKCYRVMQGIFKTWDGYDPENGVKYPVGGRGEYGEAVVSGDAFANPRRVWLLNHLETTLQRGPTWKLVFLDLFRLV